MSILGKFDGKRYYSTSASSFWLNDDFDVEFKSEAGIDYTKLAAAQRAIGNFVNIVTGKPIPVVFQSNDSSFTDGETVTIGTKLDGKNFDPAVGLALHEGSHIAHTDFNLFKHTNGGATSFLPNTQFAQRCNDMIKMQLFDSDYLVIKDLLNWIEDRRIDYKIYTTAPGYRMYYEAMYDKYFNDKIIDKALIAGEKCQETMDDYMFHIINLTNPKLFIFHVIESFSYILKSLIGLNANNICFFNLSPQNIVFNLDCGEKPILHNFQLSLQISHLNESYITNIINKQEDYTYKPLEVHVLFYLIRNDFNTISYSLIEEICENFIKNLSILDFFSEKYKESYKFACISILKQYINKPKNEIIDDILENSDKWDIFSLSVLYLHVFHNISRVFSLKQTFINKIIVELSRNIHPDPAMRTNLENLLDNFDKLFNNENDWSYVNRLSSHMMPTLFDILDK